MSEALSESLNNLISITLILLTVYFALDIISYLMGVSNTPLIHARKRAMRLKSFASRMRSMYPSGKSIKGGLTIVHFKKLKKMRSQIRKSVLVYVYDDGRHQGEANEILSIIGSIDTAANKAIEALVDPDMATVDKMLETIVAMSDSAIKALDELIELENKEKLLNFI